MCREQRLMWMAGCMSALALITACVTGCTPGTEAAKAGVKKPPAPVRVAVVTQQPIPVEAKNFGRAEAMMTVEVKSQVTGELTSVSFNEGDVVHEGQILFTIDTRPFDVALEQAKANVARAEALHKQSQAMLAKDMAESENAKAILERDTALLSRGMISQEEFDQTRTNTKSLDAVLKADAAEVQSAADSVSVARAAVDDAKLQLDYCTIRAPITGKTGSLLLHKGNLVKANDTQAIVTIKQTKPIYVSFALPEKHLPALRDAMSNGAPEVKAFATGDEALPSSGTISFLDNAVDQETGSIRLKATFPNGDDRLWPGQSLNVVVQLKVLADALVVPQAALQAGQAGPYVYVVKPDKTAELRAVKPGDTVGGLTAIVAGLAVGEQVVVDGQMRVIPGAGVSILTGEAAVAPAPGKPQ